MNVRTSKTARRPAATSKGMTLVEVVLGLFILIVGVAALFGMIVNVENANRSLALQHNSLDIFARVSAQIRDAECDWFPGGLDLTNTDPLFLGVAGAWVAAQVPNSGITLLGDGTTNPELANYVPPVRVAVMVRPEVNGQAAPSFQVDVQVRQIMRDPAQDLLTNVNGYWVRVYPVQKMCNPRAGGTPRGEY